MILPLVIPKYQTIPSFTHGLAILYANNPNIADIWVINNCLSIRFLADDVINGNSYLHIMPSYTIPSCFLLKLYNKPFDLNDDVSNMIKSHINNGYYILASVDCYFLSCHVSAKNNYHFVHPIIVYGYDAEKLFVADHFFNDDNKFSLNTVSPDEFTEGYISAHTTHSDKNYFPDMNLIQYREPIFEYAINKNHIKKIVHNYLESRFYNEYNVYGDYDKQHICGYNALLTAIDFLKRTNIQYPNNIRLLHEIVTHSEILFLAISNLNIAVLKDDAKYYVEYCIMLRNWLIREKIKKGKGDIDSEMLDRVPALSLSLYNRLYDLL